MSDTSNLVAQPGATTALPAPDTQVSVREVFGIDIDMTVPAFSVADERVPDTDDNYVFDPDTTLAILAGFAHNRRVMVQGYHGTGKSTHIEQVAARLKWPCVRINLDAHISRIDLIGRDAIVLRDGLQVTEFREGLLPWALQTPTALVFDEYDAGRPDVMFVIQRVLETEGKLTLLDQNRVIAPTRSSACSPRRTPWAWAIPRASITARRRSTRARWTAGTWSWRSTICPPRPRSTSSPRRCRAWMRK
jgi:cobaltochelatase CobS